MIETLGVGLSRKGDVRRTICLTLPVHLEKWKVSDLGLYHLHRYFCNSYVKKVVKEACSSKVIIYKSRSEVTLLEQDTIENVS